MTHLKASLKRGALIAAANWQVVVIQFVADVLFKTLLAVPIVGGVFLVVLIVGGDPGELLAMPVRDILPAMASTLMAQPLALAAFLCAFAVVLVGGSLLMFVVKGGTVTVLVSAERAAGPIEQPPLRMPAFRRATQFSLERFTTGAMALFPRYVVLGGCLFVVYAATTALALVVIFGMAPADEGIRPTDALFSLALVIWITIANMVYLLHQIVIAAEDCSVGDAVRQVARLLRTRGRTIALILGATMAVVVLATMASILATTALGLIAFVPFIGLAALPLQLIAWLMRGVVFQYIGLSALVAYLTVYRASRPTHRAAALYPPTLTPGSSPSGAGGGS